MKIIAEAFRVAGFVAIVIGCITTVVFTGYAVFPYADMALRWAIDNMGIPAIGAALFFLGFGLFQVGEWISPWVKPTRS